jgi:hypothetical protein
MILQVACGLGNVTLLAALVASDKKQNKPVSLFGKINAISGAVINS